MSRPGLVHKHHSVDSVSGLESSCLAKAPVSNVEYKCAKTANMEPDPVSKFTKTNIDSASLEAALEPGSVEVGLG